MRPTKTKINALSPTPKHKIQRKRAVLLEKHKPEVTFFELLPSVFLSINAKRAFIIDD
jgi:hypothetical protein